MDIAGKNRILFWVLIFLVVVNISVLVTLFYLPSRPANIDCEPLRPRAGYALKSELGLSRDQLTHIDLINDEYFNKSEPLVNSIRDLRSEILDELAMEGPDMILIDQKSAEISILQQQVQRANFDQYLALKQICTVEQAQRLSALYRELYGCPAGNAGNGKMHRYRHSWQGNR